MDYLCVQNVSEKWGISKRRIQILCREGRIAGAAVDVFETEPPIDPAHPLLNAKNCIATPHVAFASVQAMYKRADTVASNIEAYLAGNPVNLV